MRILTFDIEDWYHIIQEYPKNILERWNNYEVRIHNGMDKIFRVLDDHDTRATFFIVGYIARKHPEIVKRIHDLGYEVAAHSDMHRAAYTQNRAEYKEDLSRCINSLEDITGNKVVSYRAPGFSFKKENIWAFEVLHELGIKYDSSIFPAPREDGGFPNFGSEMPSIVQYNGIKIKEFPMSTHSYFGRKFTVTGGGYFRFFPYRLIRKLIKNDNYTMTYFHPRDFDPKQPILDNISFSRRFKSYFNLSKSYVKLRQIVYDFNFVDMHEAIQSINWENAPIVNLDILSNNK